MSDEIREQLSALADDELNDVEQPLLLGRLQRDAELRACLGRYQLIGEVMRGTGATATLGIAGRVQQALADDMPVSARASERVALWKPVAGLAVAASVALVAVLTVTSVSDNPANNVPSLATADLAPVVAPVLATGPAVTQASDISGEPRWDRLEPSIDKRLSGYLVNHNEYAASRGVQGVMPYVRIVGHDTSE
ncbi:MAG: sigma-E factor negative regulatory protein [Gammaproteobacteria bacterium]|nr:sigma-E factor negative regulatory protein [Gammaproteobacteria bacterium]